MASLAFINHCSVGKRILHWIIHSDAQTLAVRWFWFIYSAASSNCLWIFWLWCWVSISTPLYSIQMQQDRMSGRSLLSTHTCSSFPLQNYGERQSLLETVSCSFLGARKSANSIVCIRPPKKKKANNTKINSCSKGALRGKKKSSLK